MTNATNLPRYFAKYHSRNIHTVYEWVPGPRGDTPICVCGSVGRSGESEESFLRSDVHIDAGTGRSTTTYSIQYTSDTTQRRLQIHCHLCKKTVEFGSWGGTARYNPQFDRNQIARHVEKCQGVTADE